MSDPAAPALILLLTGVIVVLVLATLVGQALRLHAHGRHAPVVENLNARINAWWAMSILLGLAFLAGRTGVVLLFAFSSFAALREFLTLTTKTRADHWALVASFFVVLPVQYWLVWCGWYGFFAVFIPVYAFLLLPILAAVRGQTENFLIRVAETQWALMIAVYCVSYLPELLFLQIPGFEGRSVLLVAFLVVVVQSSDVLQYVWGKLVGRHSIAPNLSPSKTWEGFAGGVISASLIGAALWWMTPFTPFQAGLMSALVALLGFFGGLVLSAIKRDRGIKDWGHLIAGHGGFIDRLDSVIFSAPIFFHIVRFGWSAT